MNKLIKFYKDVIASLNLGITSDGFIRTSRGKDSQALTIDKLPLVLPTDDHLNTLTDVNDTGDMVLIKIPYNPLNEDIISGDSNSFKVTKNVVTATTTRNVAILGKFLLVIAADVKKHGKTRMEINNFLSELSEIKVSKNAVRVDTSSIEKWIKMYDNSYTKGSIPLIKIYSKRNGTVAGKKYNRVTTLTSPLLTAIKDAETGTSINGVKLRGIDISVFTVLLEFILNTNTGSVVHSSNHTKSPGFISMYGLYIKIAHRHHKLLKQCSFVDAEEVKDIVPTYEITVDDLDDIDMFDKELAILPNDNSLLPSKTTASTHMIADVSSAPVENTAGMTKEEIALAKILNHSAMNTQGNTLANMLQPQQNNMGLGNSMVPGSLLSGGNGGNLNSLLNPNPAADALSIALGNGMSLGGGLMDLNTNTMNTFGNDLSLGVAAVGTGDGIFVDNGNSGTLGL